MQCKKCDYEFDKERNFCPDCGEPTSENNKKENDDDNNEGILETIGNFIRKIFG